jgi:Leucine-rich repeat (LRR) protein
VWGSITTLTVPYTMNDVGLARCTGLRDLSLNWNNTITDLGLAVVAPHLTSLSIGKNIKITAAPFALMRQLTALTMNDPDRFNDSVEWGHAGAIFAPPSADPNINDEVLHALPQLSSLNLFGNNSVTDDGFKNLRKLKTLNLDRNKSITNAALVYTPLLATLLLGVNTNIDGAGFAHVSGLTSLDLGVGGYRITNQMLAHLPNLKTLSLGLNHVISDDGIRHVQDTLTSLSLGSNDRVTDVALMRLSKLTHLSLSDNGNSAISDTGIGSLTNLTHLSLSKSRHYATISDKALENLKQLRILELNENRTISDVGLGYVPLLEHLHIGANPLITERGLHALTHLRYLMWSPYIKNTPLTLGSMTILSQLDPENRAELETLLMMNEQKRKDREQWAIRRR